ADDEKKLFTAQAAGEALHDGSVAQLGPFAAVAQPCRDESADHRDEFDAGPRVTVKYVKDSLATDAGARSVYRKLISAAAEVCPSSSSSLLVTAAVKECRQQSVARAVQAINDSRL